jgi:hypothetical protein
LPTANLSGAFNLEEYDMATMTSRRWARVSSAAFGFLSCCTLFTSPVSTSAQNQSAISRNYDFVRSTYYSPVDVIEGIKNLAEAKSWQFVRTDVVKRNEDEVTFVVVCVPTVAPAILPVRTPPSVMPPCALIVVAEKATGPRFRCYIHNPMPNMRIRQVNRQETLGGPLSWNC